MKNAECRIAEPGICKINNAIFVAGVVDPGSAITDRGYKHHLSHLPNQLFKPCQKIRSFCISYSLHSVVAATAVQSTISLAEQPRETSQNGRRKPCISGPMAVAPASRSVAL